MIEAGKERAVTRGPTRCQAGMYRRDKGITAVDCAE